MKKKASKRYRYVYEDYGRIRLVPSPSTGPDAVQFALQVRAVCRDLYFLGASANSICASGAGVEILFQHRNMEVNRERVRTIIKEWKKKYL